MNGALEKCEICPRRCGVDRRTDAGICGCGEDVYVAKVMLHMWEEPCISGENGSGAVFFCGCPLGCVYCQNRDISRPDGAGKRLERTSDLLLKQGARSSDAAECGGNRAGIFEKGKVYTVEKLARAFLDLQERDANNVNLVSPTQYTPQLIRAIKTARDGGLKIPIVWNTGGYERPETIRALRGAADIFLCDFKYFSPYLSGELSAAPDYKEFAAAALREMADVAGGVEFDENSIMRRGVIVRHLVLPGARHDSVDVLKAVASVVSPDKVMLSLMRQYTPDFFEGGLSDEKLNRSMKRRVTSFEYDYVVSEALKMGFRGYTQDKDSAKSAYTPIWDE